ncbi:MAG: RDD family protein [Bryobacteraceae bacterium]
MKLERAGFWRRLAAAWIDWSLIYAVSSILIGATRLASMRVSLGQAGLAVAVVYGVVCLNRWGATPGKALMGVWVQRKNGQAMNLRIALLREGAAK